MFIRQSRNRIFRPLQRQQSGFTLLEVLVAFCILMTTLAGMMTAINASSRLNVNQRNRSLAQDLVRDVITKYVRSMPFDDTSSTTSDLTPYDEGIAMTEAPYSRVLYDSTGSTVQNYLGLTPLHYMEADIKTLGQAKLELLFYPIKTGLTSPAPQFFTTKLNVVARLTWAYRNGMSHVVEVPAVVGDGDVTRAQRGKFTQPAAPPSTTTCTTVGVAPPSGGFCCAGLTLVAGLCATVSTPTCTPLNQLRSANSNLPCCSGTIESSGTCIAAPTCTPAGQLRSANGNLPCCSGTTETAGMCVAACTTVGQSPPSGGSCCSGLVLNSSNNTCITCIAGGNTPPSGNALLCCSGQVFANGANAGQCKNN